MILQTSKKYKTIKHIVLHWGERGNYFAIPILLYLNLLAKVSGRRTMYPKLVIPMGVLRFPCILR